MENLMGSGAFVEDLKVKSHGRIQLSNRDLDVIQFLLEMKFASILEIEAKFFDSDFSKTGGPSPWAYRRLKALVENGYLTSRRLTYDCRQWYQATSKALSAISNLRPHLNFAKPIFGIDIRTFDHDRKVLRARLTLERLHSGNLCWISERNLKCEPSEHMLTMDKNFLPDGIYVLGNGKRVAFEMEIATKSRARYSEKVRKFVEVMRSSDSGSNFQQAHFVCEKSSVLRILREETDIYGDLFVVEMASELSSKIGSAA